MIEVNIWLSTAKVFNKRVKHGIFGPLLASEDEGENVGHCNLLVEIDERSPKFEETGSQFESLVPKKTLKIVPTPVKPQNPQDSHLAPAVVKSNLYTQSFWPKNKPSIKQLFKDFGKLIHISKGGQAEPDFGKHEIDMCREETLTEPMIIEHGKFSKQSINDEKLKNIDLCVELSDLESALESLPVWEGNLKKSQTEKSELLLNQQGISKDHKDKLQKIKQEQVRTSNQLLENGKKQTALTRTRNYLSKISYPDKNTQMQLQEINGQFKALEENKRQLESKQQILHQESELLEQGYQEALRKIESSIKQIDVEIEYAQRLLSNAHQKISGRSPEDAAKLRKEWVEKVELLARKEQFLKSRHTTQGRHPEYSISLPSKSSGLTYALDDELVLQAILQERNQSYSFILNNCVSSVKRCIIAGIDQPLKEKLKETGLTDNFFKVSAIETCKGLRTWTKTLEAKLNELNFEVSPTIRK
ncbi:hypothetical protein [Legionella waltersii]|uniref:Uncharacterized protein n=1 Tax=Legionella waltersii TaxID=66969 RepID=A0A0W1A0V0_9GAMM|nr:hypothetical protein [Legionella waltersii]KTD74993.1 hypothetical protein Lwal_3034 [Legionella waltersii]SNV08243.1 Uncharacterised protein [Legionella waltersii]